MKRARPLAEIEADEKTLEEQIRKRRRMLFELRRERTRSDEFKQLRDIRALDLPAGALSFFNRMAKHMSTGEGEALATDLRFWRGDYAARRVNLALEAVDRPAQATWDDMPGLMHVPEHKAGSDDSGEDDDEAESG